MADKQIIDAMWDDSPVDVSTEVNFIWSIANKLRGPYRSDKYKDVIIPMTIIRRFECALAPTKQKVVDQFKANPNFPAKAMYRISGFQFYNTSEFDLAELVNDADHIAANFKSYLQGFSANVLEILMSKERGLNFGEEIDKMDKNNRLLSVIKAFSELDLNPRTIDNVKMGYIFEELIRKFSENAEAGDHYTGRDIIKLMVNILLAEGCDDIFDDGKVITILDQACGTGGMLSTGYNFIKRYNPSADVRLFGQEINPESYAMCLAEMLIKGQNAENICYQDTMKADRFKSTKSALCLKIRRSVLHGAVKMPPKALRMPSTQSIRKAWTVAGAQGCPAPAICRCCFCSLPSTKWTITLAVPLSSKTAVRCSPAGLHPARARSAVGCWKTI